MGSTHSNRKLALWVPVFCVESHDLGLQVVGQIEGFLQRMLEQLSSAQAGLGQRGVILVDADIRSLQEQFPVSLDYRIPGYWSVGLAHWK